MLESLKRFCDYQKYAFGSPETATGLPGTPEHPGTTSRNILRKNPEHPNNLEQPPSEQISKKKKKEREKEREREREKEEKEISEPRLLPMLRAGMERRGSTSDGAAVAWERGCAIQPRDWRAVIKFPVKTRNSVLLLTEFCRYPKS